MLPIVLHSSEDIPLHVEILIREGYINITITCVTGSWYIHAYK
jgi:hypothetical protein